jgi:hypothetical protein
VSIDTSVNPATAADEAEHGLAVPVPVIQVDSLDVIDPALHQIEIADVSPTPPARQEAVELEVANGPARVGDVVLYRGRRGMIAEFLYRGTGKRAGWRVQVVFEHTDGQPDELLCDPKDVSILLDERDDARPMGHQVGLAVIESTEPEPELPGTPEPERYRYPITGYRADYIAAPALLEMAQELMREKSELATLADVRLRFYWWRKIGKKGCEGYFGQVKKISGMLSHHLTEDAYVAVSAFAAGAGSWTREEVKKALHHLLLHVGVDEKGNLTILDHDWLGFSSEVREYGAWSTPLKLGRNAYREAQQLGLLDDDDDEKDWSDVGV